MWLNKLLEWKSHLDHWPDYICISFGPSGVAYIFECIKWERQFNS